MTLESAFASYPRPAVDALARTNGEDPRRVAAIAQALLAKPRESLTASDLVDYFYLAVNHVGDADHLRYFLPRILTVISEGVIAPKHLPALFTAAEAHAWPEDERAAIREWLAASTLSDTLKNDILRSLTP